VKNAEELAGASAMFVVVRAKSNFSRHIQNSPLPNIAPNTNWTLPSISAPIFFPGVHAESPPSANRMVPVLFDIWEMRSRGAPEWSSSP
jgi:hypothetical protein